MHATMFNTSAPGVLNYQQNKKNVLHLYCTETSNFSLYSEALSTVHFKV